MQLRSQKILERPDIPRALVEKAEQFRKSVAERGVNTGISGGSAIVPCIVGDTMCCMFLAQRLEQRGISVMPIVYPAVDHDAARLRFFISYLHTEEQLRYTADVLAEEYARVQRDS